MRLVENETRLTMNKRRNFVNYATITLSDGRVLNLKPSDFRISGNTFTDDWADGEAFQLGSVIGKTATLLLDNTDGREEEVGGQTVVYPHGKFSDYDFYMAYFVLYVCLPEAYHYNGQLRDQMIRIGTFTVTTPTSHGSTIEITGVDNMYRFDRSFDECTLNFDSNPTLQIILSRCCTDCKVPIGYSSFSNQSLTVSEKPEGVTYRQVVSWIAQIAGCNAIISDTGALKLKWYDISQFSSWLDGGSFKTDTTPYSDGDTANGGSFNPWNTGYIFNGGNFTTPLPFHNLTATNGTSISTDDIYFTGVEVINEEVSAHYPNSTGWDYYKLVVSDNPFVAGRELSIASFLYSRISSLVFRPFSCSSLQDPTIEAGDCALVYDVKGNTYKTIITNVTFKTGGMTDVSCKSESPVSQNSRYVNPAAMAVAKVEKEQTDYNAQVAHFNELASQALGYYRTDRIESGATVTYIHNNPTLENSNIRWKITIDGIFISEDGGQSYNSGYDVSTGTMLMNLVYAHGITADWINTGTLKVGGSSGSSGNVNGSITVYDTSDNLLASLDANGFIINSGILRSSGSYIRDGVVYRRGVEINQGNISFIAPASSDAEAYINMYCSDNPNAKASMDIYTNRYMWITCGETLTLLSGANNRTSQQAEIQMNDYGIEINPGSASGRAINLHGKITVTSGSTQNYGATDTITKEDLETGWVLNFTNGIFTGRGVI